jgi:hypothetical protein
VSSKVNANAFTPTYLISASQPSTDATLLLVL